MKRIILAALVFAGAACAQDLNLYFFRLYQPLDPTAPFRLLRPIDADPFRYALELQEASRLAAETRLIQQQTRLLLQQQQYIEQQHIAAQWAEAEAKAKALAAQMRPSAEAAAKAKADQEDMKDYMNRLYKICGIPEELRKP